MIKKYMQQALVMLRQNPLFSVMYIAGTGMAIALVMVLAVLYYVKVGNIYPEVNRSRMMVAYSSHMQHREFAGTNYTYSFSIPFVKDCFYPLEEETEAVAIVSRPYSGLVKSAVSKRPILVTTKYVDSAFWEVFEFRFLHGNAFTEADFQSGLQTAVISDELARRVFGQTDVTGRELRLDNRRYRICGVVISPSYSMKLSYAHVWLPYTCNKDVTEENEVGALGRFQVAILLRSVADAGRVKAQVDEYVRRFNLQSHDGYQLLMHGQPYLHWHSLFYKNDMEDLDYGRIFRQMAVWLLLLLLVPALNLSGMIASRMERRLPELGVRKAFGATGRRLFSQIVWENLLLTLLGGVLGLVISFTMIFFCQGWLLTMLDGKTAVLPERASGVTWDMLFNPILFLVTFLICVILNLVSALIPAYLSLKKTIVYSLSKQK